MDSLLHEIAHYVALTIEAVAIVIIAFGTVEVRICDAQTSAESAPSSDAIFASSCRAFGWPSRE